MRKALFVLIAAVCSSLVVTGVASASSNRTVRLEGNGLGVVSFGSSVRFTTRILTSTLGDATGHPSAGCASSYRELAWGDLVVQFKNGRFAGYRYLAGGTTGLSPSASTIRIAAAPKLATSAGITLGDRFSQVRQAYPALQQSATTFWRTRGGIVFGFEARGKVVARSRVYEIKDNVCPGAL